MGPKTQKNWEKADYLFKSINVSEEGSAIKLEICWEEPKGTIKLPHTEWLTEAKVKDLLCNIYVETTD